MELPYVGGLMGLDLKYDETARDQAFEGLKNRRRASPDRKR
jgi:hypothetical protein